MSQPGGAGQPGVRQPAEDQPTAAEQPPWAPPGGSAWEPPPEPATPERARIRPTVLTMLAVAAAVALLGVPFGLVWAVVAPDVPVVVTETEVFYAVPQPEQPIAADGWFAILGLPVGVLAAFGVWLGARRFRGMATLAALIAGAVGTGLLGWVVGRQIGLADYRSTLAAAAPGTRLDRPADLEVVVLDWWPPQVLGVLLVPALAAAAGYTLLAAWSRFPDLRADDHPAEPADAGDMGGPAGRHVPGSPDAAG